MRFLVGGYLAVLTMQVAIIAAGNRLFPPDPPREYLLVTAPEFRASAERADAQERRALAAESDNAKLAVENAVLRDQLRRLSAGGVRVAGGEVAAEDLIPAQQLPLPEAKR